MGRQRRLRLGCAVALLVCTSCGAGQPNGSASPRPGLSAGSSGPIGGTTPTSCRSGLDLSTWSVSRLAEQTLAVPVDESDVASIAPEVGDGAGAVLLTGSKGPADLASELALLRAVAPDHIPPLVMTDEEGGAIQRMANLVGAVPSARELAQEPASSITHTAQVLGARLRALGVTVDLAPVLDLDAGVGPSRSDPDGTRSFSASGSLATVDGLAFAAGLRSAGIIAVVKHFPGLGQATGNTDYAFAWTRPWDQLQAAGLLPFTAAIAAGVPAIMVTNAAVPGLTSLPASVSSAVITTLLRERLGYDGLVLTDSLSAGALSYAGFTVESAVVAALAAGADLALFTTKARDVSATTSLIVAAITAAVSDGQLTRDRLLAAVTHALAARGITACG